jgi:parallel beta-helix repeat protein
MRTFSFALSALRIENEPGAYMRYVLLSTILFCTSGTALMAQVPTPPTLPITQTIPIAQFGARGDGKTNDTEAFIAAITVAASEGARLQLGNATYLLTGTLSIPATAKPVSIAGGTATTLLFAPAHSLDSGFVIANHTAVELKSFTIQGSGGGLNHAISVMGSTNIRMDTLRIMNIHGTGPMTTSAIILGSDNLIWITNNTFTGVGLGSGQPALNIFNYYKLDSQNIYISHNTMSGNTSNIAIGLFDTNNSIVANNTIDGGNNCVSPCNNNGYGVLFYLHDLHGFSAALAPKLQNETIINNQIQNTAGSAIYLASVAGATITGNTITHSTIQMNDQSLPAAGIALNGDNNVTVANNVIQRDGRGGIALSTDLDAVVQGNTIYSPSKWGINLRVADVGTTIENNTIDATPIGLMIDHDAVNTLIKNNIFNGVPQATTYYYQALDPALTCQVGTC